MALESCRPNEGVIEVTERRDVTEEILAYLAGESDRPTFEDLDDDARATALRALAALEQLVDTDMNAIPLFEEDPVAVRLEFRDGPGEARIYGPAVRAAREAAGLSKRDAAKAVSGAGHTVDVGWLSDVEDGTWRTVTADIADILGETFGVPARTLGNPNVPSGVLDDVATVVIDAHDHLTVSRFEEPFGELFPRRLLGSFLDLRVLLIVCADDVERVEAVQFAVEVIVDADRFAAIIAVLTDEDLTAYPVRSELLLPRSTTPEGENVEPFTAADIVPTTLAFALGDIVQGQVICWAKFDRSLTGGVHADTVRLRAEASAAALKKFRGSAARVAADRKDIFKDVGESEQAGVNRLIDELLSGERDHLDVVGALGEIENVS